MASEETQTEERQENGSDARKTVVRAAAIAAASGATALAAKKALSSQGSSSESDGDDDEQQQGRRQKSGGGDSLLSTMAGSAWNSASGTLMPMIEDAAGQAGEYLAKNGPDIVRENIVPRFIRGFENARSDDDDE